MEGTKQNLYWYCQCYGNAMGRGEMKAHTLKKMLNNTGYFVTNHRDYIAVNSPLCHNLIAVDKKTLKLSYALDAFSEGRRCLVDKDNKELLFIWDKLQELIGSGQIQEIIDGDDVLENAIPVFIFDNFKKTVVEESVLALGWPNVTNTGRMLHDNDGFPTRRQALEYGIKECRCSIEIYTERVEELTKTLEEKKAKLEEQRSIVEILTDELESCDTKESIK
jgi:hypothetical protein